MSACQKPLRKRQNRDRTQSVAQSADMLKMRNHEPSEITYRLRRLLAVGVIAGWLLPGMPTTAEAAFYKCISTDGKTTYNDTPCRADESAQRLSRSARELQILDCRVAHNFTFDIVARMNQGDRAQTVFEAYGGARNLSEGVRSLINYVFTFSNRSSVSAQRVVELTTERCEAGLLGDTLDQCSTFPSDFIERSGGCLAAREVDQTILFLPPPLGEASGVQGALRIDPKKGLIRYSQPQPTLNAANPVTKERR